MIKDYKELVEFLGQRACCPDGKCRYPRDDMCGADDIGRLIDRGLRAAWQEGVACVPKGATREMAIAAAYGDLTEKDAMWSRLLNALAATPYKPEGGKP